MSRPFRSALLVAASMAAGLLVSSTAAHADPATKLTQAQMAAALKAVVAKANAAGKPGWRATLVQVADEADASEDWVLDPARGMAFMDMRTGSTLDAAYALQHEGYYQRFYDATSLAAVKMMGRPAVRFAFTADSSVLLATVVALQFPQPAAVVTNGVSAGTKTTRADHSIDYSYTYDDAGTAVTQTVRVNAAGVLSSVTASSTARKVTLTYSYGPQRITLPPAVEAATLKRAEAYLGMATAVPTAAGQTRTDTLNAANGGPVDVASLRTFARADAATVNKAAGVPMVKVTDIDGGARVSAANPWTHQTAAYTVKASGADVVVAAA
jgi:hypothetical protein